MQILWDTELHKLQKKKKNKRQINDKHSKMCQKILYEFSWGWTAEKRRLSTDCKRNFSYILFIIFFFSIKKNPEVYFKVYILIVYKHIYSEKKS